MSYHTYLYTWKGKENYSGGGEEGEGEWRRGRRRVEEGEKESGGGEREGEGERRRGRWRVESGSREKLSGVKRGRGNRRVEEREEKIIGDR